MVLCTCGIGYYSDFVTTMEMLNTEDYSFTCYFCQHVGWHLALREEHRLKVY
jgi:hypothetical protein